MRTARDPRQSLCIARTYFTPLCRLSHSSLLHQYRCYSSTTPSPPQTPLPHAIITGATRGIGLAVAQLLARHDFSLLLVSRSPEALSSTVSSLAFPDRHATLARDISDRETWTALLAEHKTRSGSARTNVLVNCAGVSGAGKLFVRSSDEEIEQVVGTNLLGTMWGCREVGRAMLRDRSAKSPDAAVSAAAAAAAASDRGSNELQRAIGSGVIINVASLLAGKGGAGSVAYAASKAGVVGFTRALATELGPAGIRVNAVLPGYIDTDMTRDMSADARDRAMLSIPLKRFGTVDEVAHAIFFLITNAYAHNCVLNLDGGLSAV